MRNGFCKISSWILAGVAAWGIIAVLGEDAESLISTFGAAVIMMFFGTSTLACAALYEKGQNPGVAITGLSACAVGVGFGVLMAFGIVEDLEAISLLIVAIVVSSAMTHIGLLLMNDNENSLVRIVRNTTIVCAAVWYSLLGIAALGSDGGGIEEIFGEAMSSEFMAKLFAISVLLMAVGTIVTPMLNRIYNQEDEDYADSTGYNTYNGGQSYNGQNYSSPNYGNPTYTDAGQNNNQQQWKTEEWK